MPSSLESARASLRTLSREERSALLLEMFSFPLPKPSYAQPRTVRPAAAPSTSSKCQETEGERSPLPKVRYRRFWCDTGEDKLTVMPIDRFVYPSDDEFAEKAQRCIFKTVLECQFEILRYLFECSDDLGEKIVWDEVLVDDATLGIKHYGYRQSKEMNAVTFCGECIAGQIEMVTEQDDEEDEDDDQLFPFVEKTPECVPTDEEVKSGYLQFLHTMLQWMGMNRFHGHLRELIATEGVWWTGADSGGLWVKEACREELKLILNFFVDSKSEFGEVLKAVIEGKEVKMFANAARYDHGTFAKLMDVFLDEKAFERMLLPKFFPSNDESRFGNFVSAWHEVIRNCGVQQAQQFWEYIKGKVNASREVLRRFLRQKHDSKWSVLLTACGNKDPCTVSFIWDLYLELFDATARREILFDAFSGGKSSFWVDMHVFLNFLLGVWESGELDAQETARILLSKGRFGKYHYHTSSSIFLSANVIHKFQSLLLSSGYGMEEIVRNDMILYQHVPKGCFEMFHYSKLLAFPPTLLDAIPAEFEMVKRTRCKHPWMDRELLEDRSLGCYYSSQYEERQISVVSLKMFYVLTHRLVKLQLHYLSEEEVIGRLAVEWENFISSPTCVLWRKEDEDRYSHTPFIVHFINSLSPFFPKGRLAEVFFGEHDLFGTIFHAALDWYETRAFLALYDVSRWLLGQDALWRVHCLAETGLKKPSVLQSLLARQERGISDYIEEEE